VIFNGPPEVFEIRFRQVLPFPTFNPFLGIVLKLEMVDLFLDEIPRVKGPSVNAVTDSCKEPVGPIPGVQGIIVLAGIDLKFFALPVEINEIAGGRDLTLGATQGFPLKLPVAVWTFLLGPNLSDHAEIVPRPIVQGQAFSFKNRNLSWSFLRRRAGF